MSNEHHVWGADVNQDEYVANYRVWLMGVMMRDVFPSASLPQRVLDIACGNGTCVSTYAAQWDQTGVVVGVDAYTDPVEQHHKVIYLKQDAVSFCAPDQFDVILSFEFIEHIPHYELLKFLRNMRASLKDGGWFIGSTPNGPQGDHVFKTQNPFHIREWHMDELQNVLSHFFSSAEVSDIGLNTLGFVCRK